MENKKLMDLVKTIRDDERQKIFEEGYDLGLKIGEVVAHDDQPEVFDPDTLSEDERAFYDLGYGTGYEECFEENMDENDNLDDTEDSTSTNYSSYERGYNKGYDNGYEVGNEEGYGVGYDEGYEEGCTELEPIKADAPTEDKIKSCCKTSE